MARRKRSAQGQPALPRRERGALISAGMRWRPFAHNADWAGAQRRTADGAASAAASIASVGRVPLGSAGSDGCCA